MFRLWITIVILHLLLTAGVVFAKEHDVCKHEQKFSQIWYINGCDKPQGEKNTPWKGDIEMCGAGVLLEAPLISKKLI